MRILEASNLSKRYRTPNGWLNAVRGVSMHVDEGETLGLLGANGAGKSTVIKMISGILRPDDGTIRIHGADASASRAFARDVGSVLEGNRNLYPRLTVRENIDYFATLKGLGRSEINSRRARLLDRFGLTHKSSEVAQKLSRGMQQRVSIICALMHAPRLLLMDEPTLGLDLEATATVKAVINELRSEGIGIVITTHQIEIAEELSSSILIINEGEVIRHVATKDLLSEFAQPAYLIAFDGELGADQLGSLRAQFRLVVEAGLLTVWCGPSDLYRVLAITRPLPIRSVGLHRESLSAIFLKLTRSTNVQPIPDRIEAIEHPLPALSD